KNALGKRIFELRKENNLTQGQIGKLLSVSRNAVCMWEAGVSQPLREHLFNLADALGVGVDYLKTGKLQGLLLLGEASDKYWSEISEVNAMKVSRRLPITPHPDYPADAQYAVQVRRNSPDP